MKHRARCHCGRVEFEVESGLDHFVRCNCSLCVRRSAVMFYVPPEAFQLLSGEEHLGGYQFGSKSGTHHFCQVCGVFTFFESHFAGRHQFGINAACIDGFDPYTAKAELIDGRSF